LYKKITFASVNMGFYKSLLHCIW